jgi:hypothetical protein
VHTEIPECRSFLVNVRICPRFSLFIIMYRHRPPPHGKQRPAYLSAQRKNWVRTYPRLPPTMIRTFDRHAQSLHQTFSTILFRFTVGLTQPAPTEGNAYPVGVHSCWLTVCPHWFCRPGLTCFGGTLMAQLSMGPLSPLAE